jgi:hypothetical protein
MIPKGLGIRVMTYIRAFPDILDTGMLCLHHIPIRVMITENRISIIPAVSADMRAVFLFLEIKFLDMISGPMK